MSKTHRYATAGLLAAGLLITVPSKTMGQSATQRYERFEQRAFDIGYREGLDQGERDARDGREFSFVRTEMYRMADEGYRREDGDRADYRQQFRRGFERGYREGFIGDARSTTSAPFSGRPMNDFSPAAQIGYRDGYDAGLKDLRERESYDPVRSARYRSADHNYDRRYGSPESFKRDYRVAFEEGYERAYRGR